MIELLQLIGVWTLIAGVVFLLIIPMFLCCAYHALDFYFFIWKEMCHSYVKHKHIKNNKVEEPVQVNPSGA
jgi:hypothetical protein